MDDEGHRSRHEVRGKALMMDGTSELSVHICLRSGILQLGRCIREAGVFVCLHI